MFNFLELKKFGLKKKFEMKIFQTKCNLKQGSP
jgi:hypothetical protein